ATMDLTAFEAGTLQEILAPEGSTVPIGKPVALIGSGAAAQRATPRSAETVSTASVESAPPEASAPPAADVTSSETPRTPAAQQNVGEAPEPTSRPTDNRSASTIESEGGETVEGGANGKVRASP